MSFNPGDVIIYRASLAGAGTGGAAVDLSQHLRHFSIFESLKKPYVSFQGQILDMVGIGTLTGENWLTIAFGQPGQNPYEKTFAVTSVQRSHNSRQLMQQELEIVGYSPQMTSFPKVQRSYVNQPGTDIVTDLVNTYLQPLLVPFRVDAPSRGIMGSDRMPYTLNGTQIHKAIRQTLLRAVSTLDLSSAYVFFENNRALIVDTLVNLQTKAMAQSFQETDRHYFQRPLGENFLRDVAWQNRIVLSLHEETRVDKTMTVQAEVQESRPFDIATNQFFKDAIGEGSPASYANIPYNILRPPTFLAGALPERKRAAAAFDQQSLTIHVSLNPALTVGEGFFVESLLPGSQTQDHPGVFAGNLLATEVRHAVDFTRKKMTATTTCKGVTGDMSIF
jgi:hypothetical protein